MQVLKKIIPYKVRRALPILGIAAGSMFMSSCSNDNDEPQVPQHDVELKFSVGEYDNIKSSIIKSHADNPAVRHIYLCVEGDFLNFDADGINNMRNGMEKRINVSPQKVRGRGNFIFVPGLVTKTDSLWYVKQGWTINQHQK